MEASASKPSSPAVLLAWGPTADHPLFAHIIVGAPGAEPGAVAVIAAGAAFLGALVARSRAARRRDVGVYRAVARVATRGGAITPSERAVLAAIASALDLTAGAVAEVDREVFAARS